MNPVCKCNRSRNRHKDNPNKVPCHSSTDRLYSCQVYVCWAVRRHFADSCDQNVTYLITDRTARCDRHVDRISDDRGIWTVNPKEEAFCAGGSVAQTKSHKLKQLRL